MHYSLHAIDTVPFEQQELEELEDAILDTKEMDFDANSVSSSSSFDELNELESFILNAREENEEPKDPSTYALRELEDMIDDAHEPDTDVLDIEHRLKSSQMTDISEERNASTT